MWRSSLPVLFTTQVCFFLLTGMAFNPNMSIYVGSFVQHYVYSNLWTWNDYQTKSTGNKVLAVVATIQGTRKITAKGCEFAGTRSTGHQCHRLLRETGALSRRGRTARPTTWVVTTISYFALYMLCAASRIWLEKVFSLLSVAHFQLRIVNSFSESGQHFIICCIAQTFGSTVKSNRLQMPTMSGTYNFISHDFCCEIRLVELIICV